MPEKLAHLIALPQQRQIGLSTGQELLETQKWHPRTTAEVRWSIGGIIVVIVPWAFRAALSLLAVRCGKKTKKQKHRIPGS